VITEVKGNLKFANTQTFVIDNTEYKQDIKQSTEGLISTTTTGDGIPIVDVKEISYPFTLLIDEVVNSDGSISEALKSDQKFDQNRAGADPTHGPGWPIPFIEQTSNEVISANTLYFDASGNYTGNSGSSSQNYVETNSDGYCYSGSLTSNDLALTSYSYGKACKGWGEKK
jgi:hypothetical protein